MDKKQKSNYREIKKKMKKLTLAEKKQIKEKEKEKEKEQRKEKQQKITQRVKVNINIPRSIGGSQSSGFSNFPFPKDNTEQTTLLKSINEQLKQKNEPKTSNQLFSIPSSVMTNPQDLTNRNVISPQRMRNIPNIPNIPNVINKPRDTSNLTLDEVVKKKLNDYNEGLRIEKEPLINLPEDTSNLGLMERINKKEEIKPDEEGKSVYEEGKSVYEETERKFKIKKKQEQEEEEQKRLKDEETLRLSNLEYEKRKKGKVDKSRQKVKEDKQAGIERAFSVLLNNSTTDEQNMFRSSFDRGFLPAPRIRELLANVRIDPSNQKSKKKFTRYEITSFFNNE